MAFKVTFRLKSHSSKEGLMDWDLVEQLGLQAPVAQQNGFSKSPIRLQLENGVNGQAARMSSLGKKWSGSRMAPKPKGGLGPRLGGWEADS